MAGCMQDNNNTDSVTTTRITETETDIIQPTTEAIATGILSYSHNRNKINLKIDNHLIQTIELDNVPDDTDIVIEDYDFDGYDDIFISETKGSSRGIYYHYDTLAKQFVPWEELNQIGWELEIQDNQTLLEIGYHHYGSTHTIYHWDNTKLTPEKFIDFYFKGDYEIADYYQYADDEKKILYGRKLFQPDSDTCIKKIEYPIYFEVHENAIDVMKNNHVIQTIAHTNLSELVRDLNERAENGSVAFLERGSVIESPEKYLETYDYDFDGYDDLFIPTNLLGTRTGVFYHFNQDTEQFELWDELNQIGTSLYPEAEQLTAYGQDSYTYEWDEQKRHINLVQRKHSYQTEDGNRITEIYKIDENGNEILVKTE